MRDLTLRIILWCGGLLACLAPVLLLLLLFRRKVGLKDACCAKCRYPVRGLPSNICPECGSDLRATGTIHMVERRPLGRTPRLLIWSVLLLIAWWLLSGQALGWIPERLLWPAVPKRTTQFVYFDIGTDIWASPDREWMRGVIQVAVVCDGSTAAPPPTEVLIIPHSLFEGHPGVPPGRQGLHISLTDGTCHEEDEWERRVGPPVPFTTLRLRKFLEAHHLPQTDDHIQNILRIVSGATSNSATWAMAAPPAAPAASTIIISSHSSGQVLEALVSIPRIVNLSVLGVWLAGLLVLLLAGSRRPVH